MLMARYCRTAQAVKSNFQSRPLPFSTGLFSIFFGRLLSLLSWLESSIFRRAQLSNFVTYYGQNSLIFCLDNTILIRIGEGLMSRNLFWLSDEQWARIEPHLPTDVRGVERADDRRVISGIVHVLKCGCRWCDCPEAYGPPFAGRGVASGKTCFGSLPSTGDP